MDNVTYANTVRTATTLKDTDILVIQQRNSTESLSTTDFTQMKKITVTNLLQTTQKLQSNVEDMVAKFDSTGQTVSTSKTIKTDSIGVSGTNGTTIPITSVVKEYVDAESTRARAAEDVNALNIATNAETVQTALDELVVNLSSSDRAISALDGRLDTLEGAGEGSVKKAINDAVSPLENDLTDLEGAGHTNETVKGNADAVALRELLSNKVTAFQEVPTDTAYPSEKLVDDSLKNLAGTGRTTETVKQNADTIRAIKGTGYTEGSLKTHEDRIDTLDENKLNITDYNSDTDLEIGKIQFYFRYAVPTGYLLCDGSYISQTDYPKLYAQLMLVYNNCVNHGNLILDRDLKITLPNLTETKTSLLSATTPTEIGSAVSSSVSNMGFSSMTSFIKPVMLLLPCIKCDN